MENNFSDGKTLSRRNWMTFSCEGSKEIHQQKQSELDNKKISHQKNKNKSSPSPSSFPTYSFQSSVSTYTPSTSLDPETTIKTASSNNPLVDSFPVKESANSNLTNNPASQELELSKQKQLLVNYEQELLNKIKFKYTNHKSEKSFYKNPIFGITILLSIFIVIFLFAKKKIKFIRKAQN